MRKKKVKIWHITILIGIGCEFLVRVKRFTITDLEYTKLKELQCPWRICCVRFLKVYSMFSRINLSPKY